MRVIRSLFLFALVFTLASCTPVSEPPAAEEISGIPDLKPETVAQKLRTPWSIAVHDGTFYISERSGTIVKVNQGNSERQRLKLKHLVYEEGEGGFLGIVLAPDFAQSRLAYAYYTYRENGQTYNRVIMIKELEADGLWTETKTLIDKIPGAVFHNGGRLAIGPDQHLYITTGDARQEELAQNVRSLAGKILRLKLNGEIPEDNPFPHSYVYSYGHRNPQGLAWDADGNMYSSEHGPSTVPGGHDEINLIKSGKNYGWPKMIGDEKKGEMISPLYHSGDHTWAPSGIAIDQKKQIYVAALRGQQLLRFSTSSKKAETVLEGMGRFRDVYILDDELYILTNNTDGRGVPEESDDRLLKIKLP
ncbi:PQQ-dependent sugar dehydrogenase [Paenactinomyces guangxiensis]|uniref:PQQ-dependent sugar dehydrogenase n=1 Tax=Paenactinomyces guangxiensis TaxID=1490290 RepID=A0A7W1WTG2_9BACL|nr:PQQ-dependent sugar dehydrogenase [Paenactinomyces guangxiensis]MBA4495727.1 PQQ-dependent sugar dehydrogenase [Paenactinomyces guangxiensis]MBH8592716.1 PQQ-dependent sugar dehydrogenase [Paenactinomyces guangxiensis]